MESVFTHVDSPSKQDQHREIPAQTVTKKAQFRTNTSTDGILLAITPDLDIPTKPLPSVATQMFLASKDDLVDAGGTSQHPPEERLLAQGHPHGFISAVTAAFANHYPLVLRPQHFWLLMCQAVAVHVDLNAEAVRENWVAHTGKKELVVRCDEFVINQGNDWASVVMGKEDSFAIQIEKNGAVGVAEVLSPQFSSTTSTEDLAQKIVVMNICKKYFSYGCLTLCGFPEITLEGSEADWHLLREAAERLLLRCVPQFADQWGEALLPLLDKLAAARRGEVDAQFWNSMCKRGGNEGSGGYTWFNGWFNIFFPIIQNKWWNCFCVAYHADAGYVKEGLVWDKYYSVDDTPEGVAGSDCSRFNNCTGMSIAPVIWDCLNATYELEFNAGFLGATQDPVSLQIQPQIGWYITTKAETRCKAKDKG